MRQCAVERLKTDMVLARPVMDQFFRMLLGPGVRLTPAYISKLNRLEINFVYVMEPGTDFIAPDDIIGVKSRKEVFTAFDEFTESREEEKKPSEHTIRSVGKSSKSSSGKTMMIRRATDTMLKDVLNSSVSYYYPSVNLSSNPSFNHAFDVAQLSMMLGMRFHYSENELLRLGEAGLLHDMAKSQLDESLVTTVQSKFTQEQLQSYYLHPDVAMNAIMSDRSIDPAVAMAVHQHHEHHDGSGFPQGLEGSSDPPLTNRIAPKKIFRLAEILAVANYFDNLLNGRIDGKLYAPLDAVDELIQLSGSYFNPNIVRESVAIINVFPLGCNVNVSESYSAEITNYRGVVAKVNPSDLHRPEVLLLYNSNRMKLEPPLMVDFSEDKYAKLSYIYSL
ncbi:MAG: HD domain-containing phosphohydrolase [Candidatus Electryonea clarkiae]|nr:HD domain-containing phosphohydrolase [Candidatus Electryonea clarkiae]